MSSPEPRPDTARPDTARLDTARPNGGKPVLARIVAAHGGAGPGKTDLTGPLRTGLTRAIRRAALPFTGLMLQLAEVEVRCNTNLTAGIDALPEHGLLAALEDEEGRRGLIALGHGLVDALIEVQATGRVEDTDLPPRPVTRIDEALCRDFLDLVLAAFAKETEAESGRDWPDRLSYGSRIDDRGQLTLLLPESGYHLLTVSVTAAGRKTGDLVFLMPMDPSLVRRRAGAAPAAAQAAPVDWSTRMLAALGAAPMALDAVLMRTSMPLGRVQALAEGDLIPFTRGHLAAITLEGEDFHVFARGALGQLGGQRAVRFGGAGAALPGTSSGRQAVAGSGGGLAQGTTPQTAALMVATAGLPPAGQTAPLPALNGFDPDAPMGGFDPDALMGGFDPDAPMGGFDPDAPMGGFDPDAPMG